MLRYLTAGESHGKSLTAIIEGLPSNLVIDEESINQDLKRRQGGYGRGGRMKIESDQIQLLSGVRHGKTLGSPVTLFIENKDWKNWSKVMGAEYVPDEERGRNKKNEPVTRPRPGHADLSGALKYNLRDIRNVLERSSARETAVRVAVGSIAKRILDEFGINVFSWVTVIGGIGIKDKKIPGSIYYSVGNDISVDKIFKNAEASDVRCPDEDAAASMRERIDEAKDKGDTVGGIFEVVVSGLPAGLGSYVQYDRKLDAALAGAMMSIQAIKGVEIGLGFEEGRSFGSQVHDEIFYGKSGYYRRTNYAGGIEGGMTNGEDVVVRAVMKPIPTLYQPLKSVDIETKEPFDASVERSDVCAVPAAAVIGEAVTAIEIARLFLDKFGGDSIEEIRRNYNAYLEHVSDF